MAGGEWRFTMTGICAYNAAGTSNPPMLVYLRTDARPSRRFYQTSNLRPLGLKSTTLTIRLMPQWRCESLNALVKTGFATVDPVVVVEDAVMDVDVGTLMEDITGAMLMDNTGAVLISQWSFISSSMYRLRSISVKPSWFSPFIK